MIGDHLPVRSFYYAFSELVNWILFPVIKEAIRFDKRMY
jgi:hypothetical protein